MGATTRDIFGDGSGAQHATAGSYGTPPGGFRLPETTSLGVVKLQVSNLARSLEYYGYVLGLRVLTQNGGHAVLAAHGSDVPLLELHEKPGAIPAGRRSRLGLYHFAILVPDRATLGRFVQHLADIGARAGSADHLLSEALYLQDPDNLGIEVYADRPRSAWNRVGRELMMASDPLDVVSLVEAGAGDSWRGMPAGTVMGHVHLHVGDIERGAEFYAEGLGFDRMAWSYPGALFLGAGGYHHHLGTNTWAGPTAQPAAEHEPRLLEWTIHVPHADDVEAAAESLSVGDFAPVHEGGELLVRDPWGTAVRVRSPG